MRRLTRTVLIFGVLSATACFHQVVQTGRPAGSTVVDRQFVATWLWGIVPAQPIDVRQQCPSGVATIETEQSFMNGLVGLLTLGIYSPQHLRVTCAASSAQIPSGVREFVVPSGASESEFATVFEGAVREAIESATLTVLRF